MILAAAEYADTPEDKRGAPPPVLALAFQCDRWHYLPRAGGIQDQPAGLLNKMNMSMSVYNAIQGYNAAESTAEWAALNPGSYNTWQMVMEIRKEQNGR